MAYLDALGIDAYVSRAQLPGAALTRRLAIVPAPTSEAASCPPAAEAMPALPSVAPRQVESPIPKLDSNLRSPASAPSPAAPQVRASVPHFSLFAIAAGDWLWLEDMSDMPLASDQVQLVQAMARALTGVGGHAVQAATDVARPDVARPDVARPATARPDVEQFRWPIHTNQQLDLGEEAARAALAGFVGRRLEERQCRGLVLLGEACRARVPLEQMAVPTVSTLSTAEMLANPQLKRQVWLDLLPLA
jgi:hypothetical protein